MKNYEIKKNRSIFEMIDLQALSACKLNDFEAFDRILFGEGVEPDFNKFYADDLHKNFHSAYEYTVAVPFYDPTTMVEYQINHYVMWGVIALVKVYSKPTNLVAYNTSDCLPVIENDCWACEWSLRHEKFYFCQNCPIWFSQDLFRFMCESDVPLETEGPDDEILDGYVEWDTVLNEPEDYEQAALKIQKYLWHSCYHTEDFYL